MQQRLPKFLKLRKPFSISQPPDIFLSKNLCFLKIHLGCEFISFPDAVWECVSEIPFARHFHLVL
jgi:hypothetical protein